MPSRLRFTAYEKSFRDAVRDEIRATIVDETAVGEEFLVFNRGLV